MIQNKKILKILLFIFLILIVSVVSRDQISLSGNESSRLAVVQSVVDNGSFCIDNSSFKTVDKVCINGSFYSDKPLFLPLCLSGVYYFLKQVLGMTFNSDYYSLIYILNLVSSGLFLIFFYLLFVKLMSGTGYSRDSVLMPGLGLVLCTWIFSFGGTVNNHVPAAFFLFLTLYMLVWGRTGEALKKYIIAGLSAGILFNLEIPAALIFSAFLSLFLLYSGKIKGLFCFWLGILPMIILMAFLDYLAYGSALPAYMIPGAYEFAGNIHSNAAAGLHRPDNISRYFFDILVGDRGFFSYMPVMIFIIPTLLFSKRHFAVSDFFVLTAAAAMIIFYGFFTGDYGGWSYGFRFLIPLIPVFWFYICLYYREIKSESVKKIFYILLFCGFISSAVGAYNPWPVVYEGAAGAKGAIEENFKSPFMANLLCISFEYAPDSSFTRFLCTKYYNPELADKYLYKSFINMQYLKKNVKEN